MKKEKKAETLPLKAFIEKRIKKPEQIDVGEGSEKLTIKINPTTGAIVRANAIISAASLVFNEFDSGVGGYMPAFLEFAHKYGVLLCYTDLKVPQELEHAWPVINYTPIYKKVVEIVGEDEIAEFGYQLNELIEARLQERIHMLNFERILDKVSSMLDSFGEQFKNFDMEKTLKQLEDLPRKLGGLKGLGGVDNVIKTFVDASGKLKADEPSKINEAD